MTLTNFFYCKLCKKVEELLSPVTTKIHEDAPQYHTVRVCDKCKKEVEVYIIQEAQGGK